MYYIKVTPANKNFQPHLWKEGGLNGLFPKKETAEFYANQMKNMKDLYDKRKKFYSKIEVLLFNARLN